MYEMRDTNEKKVLEVQIMSMKMKDNYWTVKWQFLGKGEVEASFNNRKTEKNEGYLIRGSSMAYPRRKCLK